MSPLLLLFGNDSNVGPVPNTVKFVTEGDSITDGLGATGGQPGWPGKTVPPLMTDLTKTYFTANVATSGYAIINMDANFNTRAGAEYDPTKELNVLAFMGGTNDGAYTDTFEIYKNYRRIVRKARITGFDRVAVGTIPSRSNGTGPGPNNGYFDAISLPVNILIQDYWDTDLDADGIIDWASDPGFDTTADSNSTTNYVDKLHMNNNGYTNMALVAAPVVNGIIAAPGVRGTLPATFFPIDVGGDFTITNGNRTVERTAVGNKETNARGAIGKSSGKWYWEMVLDVRNTAACGIFVFDFLYNYMGNRSPSNSELSLGLANNNANGGLWHNGVALTTQPQTADGDIIQWAMDADTQQIWMKRSTDANWNGNALANPATGVGGVSFAMLGLGPYYPQAFVRTQGGKVTSRFAAAEMTGSIPSGFLPLDQTPALSAPSAFTAGLWTLADAVSGGDLTVNILTLPYNGGSAITDIEYRVDGGSWTSSGQSTTGSFTLSGLTDNVEYDVEIRAVNAIGNGLASDLKSATPTAAATVPSAFVAGNWTLTNPSTSGDLTVNVTALPSNGGSAITAIQYRVDGGTWTASGISGIGSFIISGLTDTVEYDVELRAVNAIGNGPAGDLKSATPTASGFAPTDKANCAAWYDAADPAAIPTPSAIDTWNDKSGLSRHALQTTSGRRPNATTETLNGLPVISFPGTARLDPPSALNSLPAGANTSIVLWRTTNTTANQRPLVGVSGTNGTRYGHMVNDSAGNFAVRNNSTSTSLNKAVTFDTNWQITILRRTGTTLDNIRNGNLNSAASAGDFTVSAMYIGALADMTLPLFGAIAEIIAYSDYKSNADINEILDYIDDKWGLTTGRLP